MARLTRLLRESAVEALLVKLSAAKRWLAVKWVSPNLRGVPDRMVLKGLDDAIKIWRTLAGPMSEAQAERDLRDMLETIIELVELKAPGKDATLQQIRRHEQFRKLGFKVTVLDSQEAVREWSKT